MFCVDNSRDVSTDSGRCADSDDDQLDDADDDDDEYSDWSDFDANEDDVNGDQEVRANFCIMPLRLTYTTRTLCNHCVAKKYQKTLTQVLREYVQKSQNIFLSVLIFYSCTMSCERTIVSLTSCGRC